MPSLIIFGIPPNFRGSSLSRSDAELQAQHHFPRAALFLEKPITSGTAEDAKSVSSLLSSAGTRTSVGYMLRYLEGESRMHLNIA